MLGLLDPGDTRIHDADCSALTMKPTDVDVVLFHGGCRDGFTAAYFAWLKLHDQARYVGIGHGSAEDKAKAAGDLRGKSVAVLDFSFDAETTAKQLATAKSYAVLDHHKTAKDNLGDLPETSKVFDMRMSGATLAWNYFHPGEACPLLARYVEDKDIWRWAYHSSKEFSAVFDLAIGLPPVFPFFP